MSPRTQVTHQLTMLQLDECGLRRWALRARSWANSLQRLHSGGAAGVRKARGCNHFAPRSLQRRKDLGTRQLGKLTCRGEMRRQTSLEVPQSSRVADCSGPSLARVESARRLHERGGEPGKRCACTHHLLCDFINLRVEHLTQAAQYCLRRPRVEAVSAEAAMRCLCGAD